METPKGISNERRLVMKKARIIVLVALLVVMLATTVSASAMPLQGYKIRCPSYAGSYCNNCDPLGWHTGWWCRTDGNIDFFDHCVHQYYAICDNPDQVCHCMQPGYTDHCLEWQHWSWRICTMPMTKSVERKHENQWRGVWTYPQQLRGCLGQGNPFLT